MCSRLRSLMFALAFSMGTAVLTVPTVAFAGPVDESQPASASGSVQIITIATDIEVLGTKKKEVSLSGEIASGAKLHFATKKNRTLVEVTPGKGKGKGKSALVIRVPAGSEVHVNTVSGHVRMSGVSGPAALQSVSGNVTVDGKPKELEAVSVSGDLYLVTGSTRTVAKSVSGKVHVSGSRGKLVATSVSGRLEIEDAKVGRCKLGTVSGPISFVGAFTGDGPHEIKSHAGKITLKLPAKGPIEIEASTFSGDIRNKITNEHARGKARISIGDGGPRVKVRSFSGGIVIEPQ